MEFLHFFHKSTTHVLESTPSSLLIFVNGYINELFEGYSSLALLSKCPISSIPSMKARAFGQSQRRHTKGFRRLSARWHTADITWPTTASVPYKICGRGARGKAIEIDHV